MSKGFLPFTMTQSSWPHPPVSYRINQNHFIILLNSVPLIKNHCYGLKVQTHWAQYNQT